MNRAMQQITNKICARTYVTTRTRNLYEILDLHRTATQVDIKNAYYKLSMIYHPDKNKDCELAAEKFREITSAYEVLGNFRLRRLYDKGIIHTAGEQYHKHQQEEPPEEEDPTTRFYKARMNKGQRPTASGRNAIYNFDEWTEAHYGGEFKRQQRLKHDNIRKEVRKDEPYETKAHEKLLMIIMLGAALLVGLNQRESLDIDKTKRAKTSTESK